MGPSCASTPRETSFHSRDLSTSHFSSSLQVIIIIAYIAFQVYERIPENFKILCYSKILDLIDYNSGSLRSTGLNQERKCLFFNRVIKKASNLMVKKYFLKKNYKKSKNRGHFQFFSISKKKSLTIIVKYLRASSL